VVVVKIREMLVVEADVDDSVGRGCSQISAEMLADCVFGKTELVDKKRNLKGLRRVYMLRYSHKR
jgi:hypothetical protein